MLLKRIHAGISEEDTLMPWILINVHISSSAVESKSLRGGLFSKNEAEFSLDEGRGWSETSIVAANSSCMFRKKT